MYKQLRFLTTMLLLAVCCGTWAADKWVKTAIADLQTNDIVVIVDQTSSMALPNNGGTSSAPTATAVTLSTDKSEITSTVATTLRWEVEVLTNTFRFGVPNTANPFYNCLYCTNSNNGVRVGTNSTNNQFTWDSSSSKLKNSATNRWVGVYDEQDWRCYTSSGGNIATTITVFYKLVEVETSPLSSITLSGTYPTTFRVGDAFNHEGMTVTATYEDATTNDVTASATFSGYDMSTTGSQTVTVSYTEGEVTKTATYDITVEAIPTHTATFSVDGQTTTEDFEEGADIEFPDVDDQADYTFLGWSTSAISGTSATAPSTLVNSATMGMNDITYYAVYAIVTPGTIATATDVLNRATTGVTGTSYTAWSGKTATSTAVYAGQSAGGNESIQLRSTSPSGIVATTSGGNAKKVTVAWNSNTANGRTLDVYGKSTAYEASSELYNSSNQGTKLGSIVYGTSTELSITGDYAYIGLRSNDGAMYLTSISIEWENGTPATYSNYCTTIPTPTITVEDATVSVDAAEHEGTLAISIENMTITSTEDLGIQFYDAEGAELSSENEPDWIAVLVAEQDPQVGEGYVVSYIVEPNVGAERTAYFKVYALNGDEIVYSNLVTITQEAAPSNTITLNAACTDGTLIYGTYYTDKAYVMHEDLVGEVVSVDESGVLTVDEVYEGGDVVPAYTALLIATADEFEGTKNYTVYQTTATGEDFSEFNMLKGTLTADETTVGDDCLFYRLTMHNGTQIGFWWGAENGGAFKPGVNKAYLAVPANQAKDGFAFGNGGDATSIPTIDNGQLTMENAYNLQGQKVGSEYKGIVIVNGKKFINK